MLQEQLLLQLQTLLLPEHIISKEQQLQVVLQRRCLWSLQLTPVPTVVITNPGSSLCTGNS